MITEQYVTFKTARLLKEVGFNAQCSFIIDEDGNKLYRPTQSLAARWIREEYHIFITTLPILNGWIFDLFDLKKLQYILCGKDSGAKSHESALEAGLQEALRLIIKNKENE